MCPVQAKMAQQCLQVGATPGDGSRLAMVSTHSGTTAHAGSFSCITRCGTFLRPCAAASRARFVLARLSWRAWWGSRSLLAWLSPLTTSCPSQGTIALREGPVCLLAPSLCHVPCLVTRASRRGYGAWGFGADCVRGCDRFPAACVCQSGFSWCGCMNALWPGSLLPGGILEVSVECVAVPRCGHVSAWDASASCARWVNGFGLWGSGVSLWALQFVVLCVFWFVARGAGVLVLC